MKFSYNGLQKHIEETFPQPKELQEVIVFHAFEVESIFGVRQDGLFVDPNDERVKDWIFDIKVLPDRAGDCLSHYGMAREIAGLLKYTLKKEEVFSLPEVVLTLPVEIKSTVCKRYIAIAMDNVNVGPSPMWLSDFLESIVTE